MGETPKSQLHYLPAKIGATGPASVDSYFKPRNAGTSNDGLPLHEASFRGRKLSGAEVSLPAGYKAHVLSRKGLPETHFQMDRRDSVSSNASEQEGWTIKESFPRFFLWNHDTAPTKSEPVLRCMEWLELSKHVHTSVTSEEIDQMLQSDILQS